MQTDVAERSSLRALKRKLRVSPQTCMTFWKLSNYMRIARVVLCIVTEAFMSWRNKTAPEVTGRASAGGKWEQTPVLLAITDRRTSSLPILTTQWRNLGDFLIDCISIFVCNNGDLPLKKFKHQKYALSCNLEGVRFAVTVTSVSSDSKNF